MSDSAQSLPAFLARAPRGVYLVLFSLCATLTGGFFRIFEGPPQFLLPLLFVLSASLVLDRACALFLAGFVALLLAPALPALFLLPQHVAFAALAGWLAALLLREVARWRAAYFAVAFLLLSLLGPILFLNSYETALKTTMPAESLLPLIETNAHEAWSFAAQNPLLFVPFLALPALALLFVSFRNRFARIAAPLRDTRILCVFIVLFGLLGGTQGGRALDYLSALKNYDAQEIAYQSGLAARLKALPSLQMKNARPQAAGLTVVVIGESASRHHLALYGYTRDTTPALSRLTQGRLFVFRDVIASAATTYHSLTRALTTATLASGKNYYDAGVFSVFELLRSAGSYTAWLSNQKAHGLWGQSVTDIAAHAHEVRFTNADTRDARASRLFDNDGAFGVPPDEVLLPELDKVLAAAPRPAVVFLHLMGSHFNPADRYPPQAAFFTGGDRYIDAYDNSIRYTDALLGRIIARLAQRNEPASLLYFSDHGEAVKEKQGRDPTQFIPVQVDIPFLLWLSPAFIRNAPAFTAAASQATDKPFMLDSLTFAILDLAGVAGPAQRPENSLFNLAYKRAPRRTNEGNHLYDK